jgi:uncharacterized protein (DUF2062 family)
MPTPSCLPLCTNAPSCNDGSSTADGAPPTGVTPRELALCLALGTAIGLIPVLGVSTLLCALAALLLGLNMAAIQLVNYLLAPLQIILIIPLLRLGERIVGAPPFPVTIDR